MSANQANSNAPSSSSSSMDIPLRATTTISLRSRLSASLALPVVVAIGVIVALGSTQTTLFVSGGTWSNILRASSFVIILACFEAIVLISGGLDLSIGASLLAGAMMSAYVVAYWDSIPLAFVAAMAVGLIIGCLNGLLINGLKISPIIATLATLFGVSSVVITLSGGLAIGPLPDSFTAIGNAKIGLVPAVFIYAIIIALGVHIVLEYTDWGTRIRAVGGDREAAQKVGVNVPLTSFSIYAVTGAFSALSGLLLASNLGSGSPTFGVGMELTVIAAVVIGGVSIYGAIGTIPGVVAGSILLTLITVGLVLLRIPGGLQDLFVGLVLVIAVAIDRFRKERMFRASVRNVKGTE